MCDVLFAKTARLCVEKKSLRERENHLHDSEGFVIAVFANKLWIWYGCYIEWLIQGQGELLF